MAKIVKVGVSVVIAEVSPGRYNTSRTFPPEYVNVPNYRSRIIQLAREADLNAADILVRGDNKDHFICVVADEDLAGLIANPDIEELTQEQAIALGDVWRLPDPTLITDSDKIIEVLDKVHNSIALSSGDNDAIDPDNEAAGINRGYSFTNYLTDAIAEVG
jgi:hypothetical protein